MNVIGEESVTLFSKPEARRMEVPQKDIGRRDSRNLGGQSPFVLPAHLPWSRRAQTLLERRREDRKRPIDRRPLMRTRPSHTLLERRPLGKDRKRPIDRRPLMRTRPSHSLHLERRPLRKVKMKIRDMSDPRKLPRPCQYNFYDPVTDPPPKVPWPRSRQDSMWCLRSIRNGYRLNIRQKDRERQAGGDRETT